MTGDRVYEAIILDIASKEKLPREIVRDTISRYFNKITDLIADDSKRTIKLDYLGTFKYNHSKEKYINGTKER